MGETFFVAVGCMDGRVQSVIAKIGQELFEAIYPDTITEAGLVGQLAKADLPESLLSSLKFKIVDVSLHKHGAKGVIVHGHSECAGNPVSDKKHIEDIKASVGVIKKIADDAQVVGVFVSRDISDPNRWVTQIVS